MLSLVKDNEPVQSAEPEKQMGTERDIRSDSTKYNQGTMAVQLVHEKVNTAYNHHIIIERMKSGKARDITQEPKVKDIAAFVLGSGPSLDDSIQYLKDWEGGIICTTSHALTLMYYGIEPTHIVALDPFCTYEEIAGVDWSKTKTKLIAHPGIWPDLMEKWPNEILLFIEKMNGEDSFYATTQKIMFSEREETERGMRYPVFRYLIPTEIVLFACSPPIQMFFADFLGYKTTFLAGVDFAFHTDKERFTNYTVNIEKTNAPENFSLGGNLIWDKHEHLVTEELLKDPKLVKMDNGLFSQEIHLYYKKNLLSAWRLSKQTVYTTDHGAITEIPFADAKSVVKRQGKDYNKQHEDFIAKCVEKYLCSVGAFVVYLGTGLLFLEVKNPEVDLVEFLLKLDRTYKCTTCNNQILSEMRIDRTGHECPNCKNKTLVHSYQIDIQANILRFIRLLELNGQQVNKKDWGIL